MHSVELFKLLKMNRMESSNKDNKANFLHKCGRFTLLAAIFFCVLEAKAQSGIYYIPNSSAGNGSSEYTYDPDHPENNYYLVPAADPHRSDNRDAYYSDDEYATSGDPARPFITTYKCNRDDNSIWFIESSGDGYYFIIHAATGKYLIYEPPHSAAPNRKSMHLQTVDNNTYNPSTNNNFKFEFSSTGIGYTIRPYGVSSGNKLFNVANKNFNKYYGPSGTYYHDGIVGLYSGGHEWVLLDASDNAFVKPEISGVDENTNTFTISFPTHSITYDYSSTPVDITALGITSIIYTTNGDDPTVGGSTTHTYSSAVYLESSCTVKARGVYGNGSTTAMTSRALVPVVIAPTITFDNVTSEVTLTTATIGGAMYYTLDGSTPPTSSSTPYDGPFTVSGETTVMAITIKGGQSSSVTTQTIYQVATPTIQNNGNNAISITSATSGATIYYTTNGDTPEVGGSTTSVYTTPLTENVSGVTIKAIAVKEGMITSAEGSNSVTLQCDAPIITRNGNTGFIATCPFPNSGVTIYYTTGDGTQADPNLSSNHISSGGSVNVSLPITVKAMAVAEHYNNSTVTTYNLTQGMGGDGTEGNPYTIEYQSDVADFIDKANTPGEASKYYKVISTTPLNFSEAGEINQPFSGSFDGGCCVLTNLSHPLFDIVNGGKVYNVMLSEVNIDLNTGNAGAITKVLKGTSSAKGVIYNCGILSGSVSGGDHVGGLVGDLGVDDSDDNCYARVINCFSFADITGGSVKAGIVGYNNYASKYNDLRTMVMNCMFYGDIASGNIIYPVYGGLEISNDYKANTGNRLNNYNYFLYEAPYSLNKLILSGYYNCALAAEERFLVRFEFYRHLLNSTRELAAWYATGTADQSVMLKWVLDKSIAAYPILKEQGKYPSVVNYDPVYTFDPETGTNVARTAVTAENHGKNLGTLTVKIQNSTSGGQAAPDGASINLPSGQTYLTLTLNRIDKDLANFNFNYDKVQLPYYNDVGTGNYTENKVVTGWKIVSMVGGTPGGYTEENYDYPNYNYADRNTYGKDIYPAGNGNSGRIYSQGAYFNVPKGVTSITIEPYWAICVYLSDANYDRYGYNTTDDLTQIGDGPRYTNDAVCPVLTGEQKVYTTASEAISKLTGVSSATVYDYAIVLVGNYHHHATEGRNGPEISDGTTPFTIMSVDLNSDNEPDYCLIYRSGKNQKICPIRYDFITVPAMAMAHKMTTSEDLAIPGNCCPQGWFEITTTGLIKFGQFEHSHKDKTLSPLIFMGGVIDQFVSNNTHNEVGSNNKTKYMLFGDNVWFQMLSNGNHMDKYKAIPRRPISLTGGEFDVLYLSGYFRPDTEACTTTDGGKNAECYIDGGCFGEVAGAGQEKIKGYVLWRINHADINKFYGGGIHSVNNIDEYISITLENSRVDVFCGGPKFGNMNPDKTVTTTATNCTFGTYFGAGYGGTAINKRQFYNEYQQLNYNEWNARVNGEYETSTRGKLYTASDRGGVLVNYEYEFFAGSAGNVHRLYSHYASFSLAQTNTVTSTLTGCTVLGNYYGGGSLGAVEGDAISTLTDCTVMGSVFGGGYSVQIPTVDVRKLRTNPGPFIPEPIYNVATGLYEKGGYPDNVVYSWVHVEELNNEDYALDDEGGHFIKTKGNLDNLGKVNGNVELTITGNSTVVGNVFGGGDMSAVSGNTTVTLQGHTEVQGSVYGGGNEGEVTGSSSVSIQD